jgi:hypothetical protein
MGTAPIRIGARPYPSPATCALIWPNSGSSPGQPSRLRSGSSAPAHSPKTGCRPPPGWSATHPATPRPGLGMTHCDKRNVRRWTNLPCRLGAPGIRAGDLDSAWVVPRSDPSVMYGQPFISGRAGRVTGEPVGRGAATWASLSVHRPLGSGVRAGRLAPAAAASGWLCSRLWLALRIAVVVTTATAPHLGQGPSPPSKE